MAYTVFVSEETYFMPMFNCDNCDKAIRNEDVHVVTAPGGAIVYMCEACAPVQCHGCGNRTTACVCDAGDLEARLDAMEEFAINNYEDIY